MEPAYNRPDAFGVTMNFDNTVSLRLRIEPSWTFERAGAELFDMVKKAEERYPGWPRLLWLEIDGHVGDESGYSRDFFEFQQEFFFSAIAPFVTAFELPLTGPLVNPSPQRNDLPDSLLIR